MKYLVSFIFLAAGVNNGYCQFAPQAGIAGTTAIHSSSSLFTAWATHCSVQRGYMDIKQQSLGKVTTGDSTMATGIADNMIVSLGDSGVAVLRFDQAIRNGPGADFAVFENGFADPQDPEQAFLELAFTEVSSDGVHFFRFPAACHNQLTQQIAGAGVYMNARKLNNLAGKYIAGYGTPFDLQELAGIPGLDIDHITHVRIVDVIGDITDGSEDHYGNKINDPYPTGFPTGGFDLDAVGVIHQQPGGMSEPYEMQVHIFPNPAADKVHIKGGQLLQVSLKDLQGRELMRVTDVKEETELQLHLLPEGMYFIMLTDTKGNKWTEQIVKL